MQYVKRFFLASLRFLGAVVMAYGCAALLGLFFGMQVKNVVSIDFLMLTLSERMAPRWLRVAVPVLWFLGFVYQMYSFAVSSFSKGSCQDYLNETAGIPYSLLRDARVYCRREGGAVLLSALVFSVLCPVFDSLPLALVLRVVLFSAVHALMYLFSRYRWSRARTGGLAGIPSAPHTSEEV